MHAPVIPHSSRKPSSQNHTPRPHEIWRKAEITVNSTSAREKHRPHKRRKKTNSYSPMPSMDPPNTAVAAVASSHPVVTIKKQKSQLKKERPRSALSSSSPDQDWKLLQSPSAKPKERPKSSGWPVPPRKEDLEEELKDLNHFLRTTGPDSYPAKDDPRTSEEVVPPLLEGPTLGRSIYRAASSPRQGAKDLVKAWHSRLRQLTLPRQNEKQETLDEKGQKQNPIDSATVESRVKKSEEAPWNSTLDGQKKLTNLQNLHSELSKNTNSKDMNYIHLGVIDLPNVAVSEESTLIGTDARLSKSSSDYFGLKESYAELLSHDGSHKRNDVERHTTSMGVDKGDSGVLTKKRQAPVTVPKIDAVDAVDAGTSANFPQPEARDLSKVKSNAKNLTSPFNTAFKHNTPRAIIIDVSLATASDTPPTHTGPSRGSDTFRLDQVQHSIAVPKKKSGHATAEQYNLPSSWPEPGSRTSSKGRLKSLTATRQAGPIPVVEGRTNNPLQGTAVQLPSALKSPADNLPAPSAIGRSTVPYGLSIRSSMQSATESVPDEAYSDISSGIVMNAERQKIYQVVGNAPVYSAVPKKPQKPGPAPTGNLPPLPEGTQQKSDAVSRTSNAWKKSGRQNPSTSSPSKSRPTSPSLQESPRNANIDSVVAGQGRPPPRIDTAVTGFSAIVDAKASKSPIDPTSATSAKSVFSIKSFERAEKVRALKARDTAAQRARRENRKLEEKERELTKSEVERKKIMDTNIETDRPTASPVIPLNQPSGGSRASITSNGSLRRRPSSRAAAVNTFSPIFAVEVEPTTGNFRTGYLSPRIQRKESGHSHVTTNGTHTPPRSASPSLPSSDDEGGSGTHQGGTKRISTHRRHNTPITGLGGGGKENLSSEPSIQINAVLDARMASLERKNKILVAMVLAAVGAAKTYDASPQSSATSGGGMRPSSWLSGVSSGSASGSALEIMETMIESLRGSREENGSLGV